MNLAAAEISSVVAELQQRIIGGMIQKIQQPDPQRLLLQIRVPGETLRLLFVVAPRLARVHLTSRAFTNPQRPHGFCQKLRHDILSARIVAIEQPSADRIVRLTVAFSDGVPQVLLAELTGHHPNLFLLGPDDTILASATPSQSHRRQLRAGKPYVAPLGAPLAAETGNRFDLDKPSRAIDEHYLVQESEQQLAALRRQIRQGIKGRQNKLRRTIKKVSTDLARAEESLAYRIEGELLKANLHQIQPGAAEVTLVDWYDPEQSQRTIELDPVLTGLENMQLKFKRYKKYAGSRDLISERLQDLQREAAEVDKAMLELAELQSIEQLESLKQRAGRLGWVRQTPRQSPRKNERISASNSVFRRFVSHDGLAILVGKGARENQQLTFQIARGWEWWFHVRDWAGSHVVVRCPKQATLQEETLLDAATLAAHYSGARNMPHVEVQYCRVKEVRRPRNAPPGRVYLTQPRTLSLRADSHRLKRLFEQSRIGDS